MNRYILFSGADEEVGRHWEWCLSQKKPFIHVRPINPQYSNIFFDIAELSLDMEEISDRLRAIYDSYIDFLCLTDPLVSSMQEQVYCMNWVVQTPHAPWMAEQLFQFLEIHSTQK